MARVPDKREAQRSFQAMDFAERRAIVKAVNRGRAVEIRRHAPIAVGVAARQIRFWRWAWLFGPAVGAAQVFVAPLDVAMLNGLLGGLILGAMSWLMITRAKKSMTANLAILEGRSGPKPPGGHLARSKDRGSAGGGSAGGGHQGDDGSSIGTTPRPPAPRGKKRRGKR